jgi:hypothetical protein
MRALNRLSLSRKDLSLAYDEILAREGMGRTAQFSAYVDGSDVNGWSGKSPGSLGGGDGIRTHGLFDATEAL